MIYQNFDLEIISPQGGDRLCARVLESPQGDCPFIDVKWPFDPEEENALLTEIYGGLRQRRGRSSPASTIQDFGGKLFEAVFSGDIAHLFRSSLDTSSRAGKGLRVRLRLPEDSELHVRPWEFLFDTESREFLAVREHTPLVRYLPVAQPIPPITVEGPLRVLVALSSPTDHPRLDIAREWDILLSALDPSITAGQLELRRVPGRCTFDNLRDSLRHYGAHIFHFVGHGIPGALVLEQESGKGLEMEATHLRSAFPSGALPRLIVLNACSGAITQDVPFSGLAQGFLRQGVPAVVAMQASITDDAALIFTRYFYRDLVEIGAVDASLTEARLRMQGNGHPIEWGTPVLYMRALSGQLFQPTPNNQATNLAERKKTAAKAAGAPVRIEPTLSDRKTRDLQAKPEAPPLPSGTSQTDKKKPRTSRTRENPPQPKPGPEVDERNVTPRVHAKDSAPTPKTVSQWPEQEPAPEAPPPAAYTPRPFKPEPPPAEPDMPSKEAPPAGHTPPPFKSEPPPPAQDAPSKVKVVKIVTPHRTEPRPAEQDLPAKAPVVELRPPPTPEPPPVQEDMPPTVQEPEPAPPPRPEADEKPMAPRVQVQPPAAAPRPQPDPAEPIVPPRGGARKRTPPPRLEPILDEPDFPSNAPAGESAPAFTPAPTPGRPDAPRQAPARPRRTRAVLLYGTATSLLAAGAIVAISMHTGSLPVERVPAPSSTTAPAPAATAPASPTSAAGPDPARQETAPPAAPGPAAMPSPATQDNASRIASGSSGQAAPEMQAKAPKPKPVSDKRKAKVAAEPEPPKPKDNCKSEEVSERDVNCLFQ